MFAAAQEASRLATACVGPGSAVLPLILASIRDVYGRDSEAVSRDLDTGKARLQAVFERGQLAGYLLLSNYMDPLFHLGNQIRPQTVGRLLEDPSRRMWVIGLLHGEPGTVHSLEELGDAVLKAVTAEDPGETFFLVSLSRGGDARSWRLFRNLDFTEQGSPSWLAEIDLAKPPGPGTARARPEITWLSDLAGVSTSELADTYRELADGYNDVFGDGVAVLSENEIRAIFADAGFLPGISAVCRDRSSGCLTGFLLARRRAAGTAHIDCIGIRRAWRGTGYLEGGFHVFCDRTRAAGIGRCTFVTGRPEVRKFAERRFGAQVLSEFVWLTRRGRI